jgi:hypothetical protein
VRLISDLFGGNIIQFAIKGSRMEEGIHVCPGMPSLMDINITEVCYSDYRGLKKRISAIEAEIEAQKKVDSPGSRFTFNKSKISLNGGPSPAPPSGGGGGTTAVRFRQHTTPGNEPGRSNTVGGPSPSSNLTNNNVGWSTSRDGRYGSFGRTPPLNQNAHERPNSPPEMILPPPIKSISDLAINELSPTAEEVENTAQSQQILSESPDKLQVCWSRLIYMLKLMRLDSEWDDQFIPITTHEPISPYRGLSSHATKTKDIIVLH